MYLAKARSGKMFKFSLVSVAGEETAFELSYFGTMIQTIERALYDKSPEKQLFGDGLAFALSLGDRRGLRTI